MKDTTIIIPALKNSPILENSLEHCLKLKTRPNIIIVTDDIKNHIRKFIPNYFMRYVNKKYALIHKNYITDISN